MSWRYERLAEDVARLLRDAEVQYDLAKAKRNDLSLRPQLVTEKIHQAAGKITALKSVLELLR